MTPAQIYYVSGSHAQRRQEQFTSVHGPNAVAGTAADLLSLS